MPSECSGRPCSRQHETRRNPLKKYLTYLLLAVAVLVMLTGWFLVPTARPHPGDWAGGLVVAVAALISAIVIPSPDKAKKQAAKQSGLEGVTPSQPAPNGK